MIFLPEDYSNIYAQLAPSEPPFNSHSAACARQLAVSRWLNHTCHT